MASALQTFAGGFHTNETRFLEGNVGIEDAHGVTATTHTGNDSIGLRTLVHGRHLGNALFTDHALEITHHHWIGVWTGHCSDDVERVFYIRNPIAQGFVQCVFQGAAAGLNRHYCGTQ